MNKIEDFLKYNGFKDVSEKVPIDFHEQFGSGFGIVYVLSERWTRVKDEIFTEVKVGKAEGSSEVNIFATCYYNETYSSFELHMPEYMVLDEFIYYLNACEQRVKSICKPKDELKLNTALDKAVNGILKDWLESQKDIETLLDEENEKVDKETNVVNDETNAPTAYGKYVDECLNEASKHFFSEGEDKYSVADLFYAGVRCGKSWFENQNVEKETAKKIEKLVEENEEMKRKIHSDGLLRASSFQN